MKDFLKNQKNAYTIAKIVILFQTYTTLLISIILTLVVLKNIKLTTLLSYTLFLDIAFIILHLVYRALYSGPKILLTYLEKILLTIHGTSSLIALLLTYRLIHIEATSSEMYIYVTLGMWTISLTSGILFFIKKYMKVRHS